MRCARHVLPLFHHFWPDAKAERVEAVEQAIHLAEQSAAEGRPADGLEAAVLNGVMTAGAALMRVYDMPCNEPTPTGEKAATVASTAAKAAENAAGAAKATPEESARVAFEAYGFARDAADAAGAMEILDRIRRDFEHVRRVATRGRWNDRTPVPASVFDLLSDEERSKPWWRFW